MGYRGRIIPNVSYFYVHKRGLGKGQSQEDRAAELVRATVEFKKLVDRWVFSFFISIVLSPLLCAPSSPPSLRCFMQHHDTADNSERLEPEKGKAGPLCMASYKYL